MWSEEYQRKFMALYHESFDQCPAVVGEQIWNFADFATAQGIVRVDGNKKGIFTRSRRPKSVAYDIRTRWLNRPTFYHKYFLAPQSGDNPTLISAGHMPCF